MGVGRRDILVSVMALGALTACGTPPSAELGPEPMPELPPLPDNRRLVLFHAPSRERADLRYSVGGQYDGRALARAAHILRDRATGEIGPLDPLLLDFLWDLMYRTGLPEGTEVEVTSGFRSASTNAKLVSDQRGAGRESLHLQGRAMDFRIPILPGAALAEIAKTMQRGGAAFYPSSGHTHIDTGSVRTWRTR